MSSANTSNSHNRRQHLRLVHSQAQAPIRVSCTGIAAEYRPEFDALLRVAGANLVLEAPSAAEPAASASHGFTRHDPAWIGPGHQARVQVLASLPGVLRERARGSGVLIASAAPDTGLGVLEPLVGLNPSGTHESPVVALADCPWLQLSQRDYNLRRLDLPAAVDSLLTETGRPDALIVPPQYQEVFARFASGLTGSQALCVSLVAEAGSLSAAHLAAPAARVDPAAVALSAVWLLLASGQLKPAECLHNAVLCTLEEGVHTEALELLNPYSTRVTAGPMIDAIAARLGRTPRRLAAVSYSQERYRSAAALREVTLPGSLSDSG